MSFIQTKSEFHAALDGIGVLLQGSPDRPAYQMKNAPVYGNRFASGDRDYNDFSLWWYLTQTDWSGGVKDNVSFLDDAKFYFSSNIDAYTEPGSLRLEQDISLKISNVANDDEVLDVKSGVLNGTYTTAYLDANRARDIDTGGILSDSNGDVFDHLFRQDYYWRFVGGIAATAHCDYYNGTSTVDCKSDIDSVIDGSADIFFTGVDIGGVLYVFGLSTTDNVFCVKTSSAAPTTSGDWSLVFEYPTSSGIVAGADVLGGDIVFMVVDNGVYTLNVLDVASGVRTEIQSFSGEFLSIYAYGMKYVRKFQDVILVTIMTDRDNGKGSIYEYNGSTLTEIYNTDDKKYTIGNQAVGFLRGGAVIGDNKAYWGNLIYDGESFFNFIKTVDDDISYVAVPVGYDTAGDALFVVDTEESSGTDQLIIYEYDTSRSTAYKDGASSSAFAVMSQHDKVQSIDKLLNNLTIGFEPLTTGQSIEVYYYTGAIPPTAIGSWTSLGSVSYSTDGGTVTNKTLLFPEGTTAKKLWIRFNLISTTSGTPKLEDYTLEYLPIVDYKMQWSLNINCADEVKRLSGKLIEGTGRELRSRLLRAWMTKSALDFQDLDFASAVLADNPLGNSDTTVTVDRTDDFPEQGRIKIDDEEMFYTGKTRTTFTGVTRGVRGTLAVSHDQNAVVHNGYRVLVLGMENRVPVVMEDKHIEYVVGLTLREV